MSLKRILCRTVLAAMVVALLAAGSAPASMIVTTEDCDGADAYLQNDSQDAGTGPDVVRSNVDIMKFRYISGSRVKIPYFRFDLSNVIGNLDDATLTLQLVYNNGNRVRALDVYGLIDDDVNDAWLESTICYSNAPGFIYTDPDPLTPAHEPTNNYTIDASEMTLLGTVSTPAGVGLMTSTTASLNLDTFLSNDTNGLVTFAFVRSASDSNAEFHFATKESLVAGVTFPTLTLPHAREIPEPTSLALALVGLAAVGLLRRQR